MTIPRERFRALRWARDWLQGVATDPMVPLHAKLEAEVLLMAYPSDKLLREAIRTRGMPKDSLLALGEASRWMFTFRHPTSDPAALRQALRHMPTPAEIADQVHMEEHKEVLAGLLSCLGDWLEPDEDYVQAFVAGWHEDCAIAIGVEWLDASEGEVEDASPLYLITSSTSGIDYKTLKHRQLVLCTVPRSWGAADRQWKHVRSCVASQEFRSSDRRPFERSRSCA